MIAAIPEECLSNVLSALHAAGVGHLARILCADRTSVAEQLNRLGIVTDRAPSALIQADRVLVVTAADRSAGVACLALQRGASSSYTFSAATGWHPVDDTAVEIAATRELTPQPVLPAHRSARTFRQTRIRRRTHRRPEAQTVR
jgi:hypothetical protein